MQVYRFFITLSLLFPELFIKAELPASAILPRALYIEPSYPKRQIFSSMIDKDHRIVLDTLC